MTVFFWLVEYLASFIEGLMCCVFCGTFLTKGRMEEKRYPIILMSGIEAGLIILLNQMELFSYFNTIIMLLLFFIMQLILYKKM